MLHYYFAKLFNSSSRIQIRLKKAETNLKTLADKASVSIADLENLYNGTALLSTSDAIKVADKLDITADLITGIDLGDFKMRGRIALAEKVRAHRKKAGMTLNQVASASCVDKSTLFRIEHGKANPSLDTVVQIFAVLGVDLPDSISSIN